MALSANSRCSEEGRGVSLGGRLSRDDLCRSPVCVRCDAPCNRRMQKRTHKQIPKPKRPKLLQRPGHQKRARDDPGVEGCECLRSDQSAREERPAERGSDVDTQHKLRHFIRLKRRAVVIVTERESAHVRDASRPACARERHPVGRQWRCNGNLHLQRLVAAKRRHGRHVTIHVIFVLRCAITAVTCRFCRQSLLRGVCCTIRDHPRRRHGHVQLKAVSNVCVSVLLHGQRRRGKRELGNWVVVIVHVHVIFGAFAGIGGTCLAPRALQHGRQGHVTPVEGVHAGRPAERVDGSGRRTPIDHNTHNVCVSLA
eukprot:Opistho-2@21266